MFVITTLSMERMQITECLSAPLDILLMAKVTVLQPEVRHNTVFAQATPCLQSSAEVNEIRHRSLTSTNSHFKRGHVVVEYSNPIEFPPQNRYWLPHDLLLPSTSVNDNLSDAFPASKKCKSCIDTDGIVTCLNAQLNRNTFFFSEKTLRQQISSHQCTGHLLQPTPGVIFARCVGSSFSLYPEGQGKARLV